MHWLFAGLAGIGFVEVLMRLPFFATLGRFQQIVTRVLPVLGSKRISDHWKEKVLPRYAMLMLRMTGLLALCLIAAFIPFAVFALFAQVMDVPFVNFSMSWIGIGFISIVALTYAKLRPPTSGSEYSISAQMLHRLALGNKIVAEASMDIDQTLYPVDADAVAEQRHVFVAGLARAGTTILMRQFYATGAFRSLTYRDMPFVLAPNLWARLSGSAQRAMRAQERAHGDGIMVDFDSPEALEEVFWRIHCGKRYIGTDRLIPMQATEDDRNTFRSYVAAILRRQGNKRYLSKNNNNILRLPDLSRAFPEAVILIPFRDPLHHARSLQRQHQGFVSRHTKDPFSRRYMTWLAHHEFGADHRPFVFDNMRPTGTPATDLNYWLVLWHTTYSFVLQQAPEQVTFVCYETLCDQTEVVWPKLCSLLELPVGDPVDVLHRTSEKIQEEGEAELLQSCRTLYDRLYRQAI